MTTDYPAVQRALELSADALLVAKKGVDGVYDSDPKVNSHAQRYRTLTYEEAMRKDLRVMDRSAFVLASEHGLKLHVFDAASSGSMTAICQGQDIGTLLTN